MIASRFCDKGVTKMKNILVVVLALSINVAAQSGGSYEITSSVIAGGGTTSGGDNFSLTGTVGQSVAGTNSSAVRFAVRGGFWQAFFAPTAAMASVSGRVETDAGDPIGRVRIELTDGQTIRSAITSPFGYFRVDDIAAGQTYIITASHRLYMFAPIAITVQEDVADLTILPISQTTKIK